MSKSNPRQCQAPVETTRADIWLWAARFFKTRALAAAACDGGKARRAGHPVKPSTLLRAGDVLAVSAEPCPRQIRVEAALHRRVSAALATDYYSDLTDPAVLDAARTAKRMAAIHHSPGEGRPTKLDRRLIDTLRQTMRELDES